MQRRIYCSALLFLLGILFTASMKAQCIGFEAWRSPRYGGINALYCYLRLNGISCEYQDLLKGKAKQAGTGRQTAAALTELAAKAGVPLELRSLAMNEL